MLTAVLQSSSSATNRGLQQTVGDLQPITRHNNTHGVQMPSENDNPAFRRRILSWVVLCVTFDPIASTARVVPTGRTCTLGVSERHDPFNDYQWITTKLFAKRHNRNSVQALVPTASVYFRCHPNRGSRNPPLSDFELTSEQRRHLHMHTVRGSIVRRHSHHRSGFPNRRPEDLENVL